MQKRKQNNKTECKYLPGNPLRESGQNPDRTGIPGTIGSIGSGIMPKRGIHIGCEVTSVTIKATQTMHITVVKLPSDIFGFYLVNVCKSRKQNLIRANKMICYVFMNFMKNLSGNKSLK